MTAAPAGRPEDKHLLGPMAARNNEPYQSPLSICLHVVRWSERAALAGRPPSTSSSVLELTALLQTHTATSSPDVRD